MRVLSWLLSLWLTIGSAFADSAFVAPTTVGTAAPGQIPGTATNDAACTGCVGEVRTALTGDSSATATFTNASPTVVTWTAHPYVLTAGGVIAVGAANFTNSGGALPTGISAGTNYYVVPIDANTFRIATSVANAVAGTFVNTSSTGTGTQTAIANVVMATNTTLDAAGIQLTAGNWQLSVSIIFDAGATTTTTLLRGGPSSTAATLPSIQNYASLAVAIVGGGTVSVLQSPLTQVSIATPTTYFCTMRSGFAISTMNGGCLMTATRIR